MESLNLLANWIDVNPLLIAAMIVWTLFWKGLALWKSAGLRQKYWFVAILLVNTLGILEIIYLFFVTRNYKVEVIEKNG